MKHPIAVGYVGKGALAVIPALVSAYLSYRTATVDAEVEIARIHAKASVGYETLVAAVKTLEKTTNELNARVATLERAPAPPIPATRRQPTAPVAPKTKPIYMPKTLDDAAMSKGL